MQTARAQQIIIPHVTTTDDNVRWFSAVGCVIYRPDEAEVFVGGTLIGTFGAKDVGLRNLLLVGLAKDPRIQKGALAAAFGLGAERLRRIRKDVEALGIKALPTKAQGGRQSIVTAALRARFEALFAAGMSAQAAFETMGLTTRLSYRTLCRLRQQWAAQAQSITRAQQLDLEVEAAQRVDDATAGGAASTSGASLDDAPRDDVALGEGAPTSGRHVQHLGSWLLLAMTHALGLHAAIIERSSKDRSFRQRLRIVIDSVIIALGIGERSVEGVRRLDTPTSGIVLRAAHVPSASWTRRVLKEHVADASSFWTHAAMMQLYLEREREADDAAVFYVDNHMRPYTGKHTLRKTWRMQDKRVRAGNTDYYVHDEDGRPVFRFNVASHDALTLWLSPVTAMLRAALGESQRILVAFDRAGAFAQQLAQLRDTGFECVTYERRPYPLLSAAAFTDQLVVDGETIGLHESRAKNLRHGRGRVRRIALRMPDGRQVNLLAVSTEPAARLIEIMMGRWVQENGFKHGNTRWGINQLDGRKVEPYPPQTLIPNPARRRLDRALRLARHREGEARRLLATLEPTHPRWARLERYLNEALDEQRTLEALRPSVPKIAPLDETELKDTLVRHSGDYKTLLDTIRIACANAEGELAAILAPRLREPAEAKKVLANLFAAPGDVRVNATSITVTLSPAANRDESNAIAALLDALCRQKLTLPDDPQARPLRFRSHLS